MNNKILNNKQTLNLLKDLHQFLYIRTDGDIPFEFDSYMEDLSESYFKSDYSDDSLLSLVVDVLVASTDISDELSIMNNKDLANLAIDFIDEYKIR